LTTVVWQAALLMVKRYGDDAMLEASARADQLLDEGDMAGAETWHRILNAIDRLQAKAPAEGEGGALNLLRNVRFHTALILDSAFRKARRCPAIPCACVKSRRLAG
jgi:hypothetical protein